MGSPTIPDVTGVSEHGGIKARVLYRGQPCPGNFPDGWIHQLEPATSANVYTLIVMRQHTEVESAGRVYRGSRRLRVIVCVTAATATATTLLPLWPVRWISTPMKLAVIAAAVGLIGGLLIRPGGRFLVSLLATIAHRRRHR